MSALLPNLAVGFLSGGIAGARVGSVRPRLGRVTCVVSEWNPEYLSASSGGKRCEPEEARAFEFSLFLDFFNTRSVDTGIRGLCLLFRSADGKPVGASPLTKTKGSSHNDENRVASINLPANSLTSMKLHGRGNAGLAKHVSGGGRVEVFGYFPNKKEFSRPIDPRIDGRLPNVPMDVRISEELDAP